MVTCRYRPQLGKSREIITINPIISCGSSRAYFSRFSFVGECHFLLLLDSQIASIPLKVGFSSLSLRSRTLNSAKGSGVCTGVTKVGVTPYGN